MQQMKRRVSWRILILALSLVILFSLLVGRLWWIQSVEASWIMEKAKEQWERDRVIKPKRGSILDRNGEALAYEGKAYTVSAALKPRNKDEADLVVKDPVYTATRLAPILNMPVEELITTLSKQNVNWVDIGKVGRNKITEEQKNAILALQYPKNASGEQSEKNQLPGIFVRETTKRLYPFNSFASHLLGYVDYQDEAKMGVEMQFDQWLRGKPGELQIMQDGAGYQLPQGETKFKPAKDGYNVVLSIDHQIQEYVEQALDKAEQQFKPRKIIVLVTDPHTGEILAMGNRPQFNPNRYWEITSFENAAISYIFEPGSTFKIITLAAAIQEGVFSPYATYMSGQYRKIPGNPIKDHNNGAGWGPITFLEGVQRSSNVAFVILGYERLKQNLLAKYFNAFGVGKKTGIDLPGENPGIMRDLSKPLSQRDVAVTTFGQGVAVTAVQQAAAVGAVANGGLLMKPLIVKEVRDPHTGAVVQRFQPQVVRRVVSEKTAKQVRDILETVITGKHGTGSAYELEGYHVAGKTGTAQTYDEKTGKIAEGKYIISFIGFAPKDNPRLLIYVVVDDPKTNEPSGVLGRLVVAPIFNSVMVNSMQYLQQKSGAPAAKIKKVEVPVEERTMPKQIGNATSIAQTRATQYGYTATVIGTGTKIVAQYPAPMEKVSPNTKLYLVTDRLQGTKMPDFRGKSLREVMEFASLLKIEVVTTGYGFVQQQSIPPGTTLTGRERLQITLAPSPSP